MTGTIVNVLAIILGSLIGLYFNNLLPKKLQATLMQGLGLAVILIGLEMALETENTLLLIFSLVLGALVGESLDLEGKLYSLGEKIKKAYSHENDLFVQGFVQASLVFCVGAMAIVGSIQDGINHDPSILLNKSILDGVASIAFASSFGVGVMFSALPVLFYQGSISLLASWVEKFLTGVMIQEMTAVGGLLITAIGFNILGITKIKVGNLLPALLVVILGVIIIL